MNTRSVFLLTVVAAAALVTFGCSSLMTMELAKPRLTETDIIELSKADVGPRVIIRKIEVSRAQFDLTKDDIVRLKKAGVDNEVIRFMIGTGDAAQQADLLRSYDLYDYWFNYYNTFYPVNIHFYPVAAYLSYRSGRFYNPYYQWSEDMGLYYRRLPVGTRNWLRWDFPPYERGKQNNKPAAP